VNRNPAAITLASPILSPQQLVAADSHVVGLDTCSDQSDFRLEKFRHTGSGVQRYAQPDLSSVALINAMLQHEIPCSVGAVDFESNVRVAVQIGQADIVKHRCAVEQLQVGPQPQPVPMQRAPPEHPSGVVEQQRVLGAADEVGDIAYQKRCQAWWCRRWRLSIG